MKRMTHCCTLISLAVILALVRPSSASESLYVTTKEEVAEMLLDIVLNDNGDLDALGITADKIPGLKKEKRINEYADTIITYAKHPRQFTSNITVGHIYLLNAAIKNDICTNFRAKTNYMDKYVSSECKGDLSAACLKTWGKNWSSCKDVLGGITVAAVAEKTRDPVMVQMIRGSIGDKHEMLADHYGVTVFGEDQASGAFKAQFRTVAKAKEFFKKADDGSITGVTFFGHGGPGDMAIGGEGLEKKHFVEMLEGKLAQGAEIKLVGCNTASIPMHVSYDPVSGLAGPMFDGLSDIMRRFVYYNATCRVEWGMTKIPVAAAVFNPALALVASEEIPLPTGRADRSRDYCNEYWNLDLAASVSAALPKARVCGLRTFGLNLSRIVGKDQIEPGLVIGTRGCYKGGKTLE